MEVFNNNNNNSDHFPDQILTPFPSTASTSVSALDRFFSTEANVIIPTPPAPDPAITCSSSTTPPQKLRPIRCSWKSSSNNSSAAAAEEYTDPEAGGGGFEGGDYESGLRAEFGELVFLSRQMCGDVSGGERMDNKVCDGVESEIQNLKDAADEVGVGATIAEDEVMKEVEEEEEQEGSPSDSSFESEVSGAQSDHAEGSVSRKRRRRTRKRFEGFMLKLVSQVIQKQEAMHYQLMEVIERKERESMMREQAWKQQAMERTWREEQMRTEETSRNVAFISFIQNMLAQGVPVPEPLRACVLVKEEGQVHNYQTDMVVSGSGETNLLVSSNVLNGLQDRKRPFSEASTPGICNQRWLKVEVEALVQLHASLENKFCVTGAKDSIWDEVSARLQNMGYNRPATKCKEKWERLKKNFERTNTNGTIKSQKYKSFKELDELHKQRVLIRPPCDPSNATEGNTGHHYTELS